MRGRLPLSDLSRIIQSYSRFERKVQAAVKEFCKPYCTFCKGECCSPEYCSESVESPFLSLLRRADPPRAPYSETDGWLTESGCALTVGRPPVCYEFLCDRIVHAGMSPLASHVLKVSSHLMTHAGRFAPGRRHVVELTQIEELRKLKFARFRKRLAESETAFALIRSFQNKKPIPDNGRAVLAAIIKPPNRRPPRARPDALPTI